MNETQKPKSTEVVTKALVRALDMPMGAGVLGLITLDNGRDHTRPSTFGPEGLASLNQAISDAAALPGVAAIAVTGKPFIFAVGADLSTFENALDIEMIKSFAKLGHDVMRRLGELSVPTFAFINGAALGGGMEVALHCTYRTVSTGAQGLGLPEVMLGIVPGWGGAYLLPRLIGPAKALDVIITNPLSQNRLLSPSDMIKLGIADAAFEPADFLEQSISWAAQVVRGSIVPQRIDIDEKNWDAIVDGYRAALEDKIHDATPAPYRALELVKAARTNSRDQGFDAEDIVLSNLVMGDEQRASLYSFNLVQKRAKKPFGAPDKSLARSVNKVGIVGAGLMASQLALLFAQRLQVPVVMSDLDQARVDKGLGYVRAEVAALQAKGRLNGDKANRLLGLISGTTDMADFADAQFVLEAVFEDPQVKAKVFAELETVVSAECILATNTSSLSVSAMASSLAHPERVVGFHFFNPVAKMPLLEIARAEKTDDESLATAFAVGKSLKKTCVLVADAPAFIVNRLLIRQLSEITKCLDEGARPEVIEKALNPMGVPMPPFELMELVGVGVSHHVLESMHHAFPDRFHTSPNIKQFADSGVTAFTIQDAAGKKTLDPAVFAKLVQGDTVFSEEQVRTRVLEGLAEEARIMLDEGVVAEPQDIDLCMIMGTGMPFWLGGLTPYLDRTGTSERVTGKRFLDVGVASVPR
jgi:3-hydroxyacyl-CoA dehydrogenase/enoyl-CoA hydratase/carnithine racemase